MTQGPVPRHASRFDAIPLDAVDGVLFDLDGTLVDSAPDLLAAVNAVLADAGRARLDLQTLRPVVSKGARAMLTLAFPDDAVAQREARLPLMLAHYANAIARHTHPFAGIESLLARIEGAGKRWGIVTNKSASLARAVVAAMHWSDRCAVLVGGDTLAVAKPDPAPLLHACAQSGIDPSACVYVGDDERDIQAARAACMPSVAALWGYRQAHEDPRAWGANFVIAHPDELFAATVAGHGRD
jgi:phosphoglycolate phosphatase